MLTAIVVGVATLSLALSVCLRIYRGYGTAEEDELLEKLEREDARNTGELTRRRPRRRRPSKNKATNNQSKRSASFENSKSQRPKNKNKRPSNSKPKVGSSSGSEPTENNKPKPRRRPGKPTARKPEENKS